MYCPTCPRLFFCRRLTDSTSITPIKLDSPAQQSTSVIGFQIKTACSWQQTGASYCLIQKMSLVSLV